MSLSEAGAAEEPMVPAVLIVDEDPEHRRSLVALLNSLPIALHEARSADEAVGLSQGRHFAAVLLDVKSPDAAELAVAWSIRAHEYSRAIPIVFLVAENISRSQLEEAYRIPIVDLLVRPFLPLVLLAKVRGLAELFTEQQRSLQETEQFRLLVQGTADYAIFMLNPEGRIQTWNRGAERLKGYRAEEIIGQHFSRFYPAEAIARRWPQHELEVAREVGRFEDEGWRVRKDGTQFWANVVITALRDNNGVLRGFSKVTRDLTERKQVEEALRRSEETFRLIVESASDYAIFVLDPEGRVASWNPGAERINQYRAEEIIGQHFSRFYPQDAVESGWPDYELRAATVDGRFEDEGWRVRKDGSQFWSNVVITALRDESGRLLGFSKITRDMTERRKAEENARKLLSEATARRLAEENARMMAAERERLRVTLQSIGDAVITTNLEGNVEFLNPVAEELTGWNAAEAAGQPLTKVFQIINESTREPVENPALRALREGRIVGLANHTILISRDGSERSIDDSAAPIRGVDLDVIGSVLVFRDIGDLKRANDALKAADRQKDEFLAMLAHELRNPLAPIRSGLELLRLENEAANDTLELMQNQVDHIVRLVDDLLDVSRIVQRKIELRSETLDLSQIVHRSVEALLPSFQQQRHDVRIDLPAEPIWLRGDPVRLTQVLQNLLNNASKYTPPGGRISVSAVVAVGEVALTIRDNGIGIEPDLLPRVFDLFTQASRTLDRSQGGLGIGLTLVRALVQLHGGSVCVESPGLNQGSTFTMRLPTSARLAVPSSAEPVLPTGRPLRILAVDDNVGAAKLLSRLLTKFGRHEVVVAHDGAAALREAERFRPEVILMDIGLPGIDGYQAARTLRAKPEFQDVLLVALTGYGQEDDRRRALEAGFDAHLTKPPSLQALQAVLGHPRIAR